MLTANQKNYSVLLTCTRGFETQLAAEVLALSGINCEIIGGGVRTKASLEDCMKFCLWSREANKVQVLLAESYIQDESNLYDMGKNLPLEPWFTADAPFCIRGHVNDKRFNNPLILSLKLKDGIVDRMRELWGRRASIDTERPSIVVGLQLINKKARVFIELQGDSLNMRGYRKRQIQAPIRETLAASMIGLSDWDEKKPFWDPMCGSGTIAIEAALKASKTAPGIQRHFGFEKLPFFEELEPTWKRLRDEAREISREGRKAMKCEIFASDIDAHSLEIAVNNAQTAGVDGFIKFSNQNILKAKPMAASIVTNPPYGERISVGDMALEEFYYQIGRHLRTFGDADLTIISTQDLLKKQLHMRPYKRVSTYNGPLACEVACYTLGRGKANG